MATKVVEGIADWTIIKNLVRNVIEKAVNEYTKPDVFAGLWVLVDTFVKAQGNKTLLAVWDAINHSITADQIAAIVAGLVDVILGAVLS